MEIDPPGLGLAQPVARGRYVLVLQISSADRRVAFSTSTHGGGRVVPSIALILAWEELENTTGNSL